MVTSAFVVEAVRPLHSPAVFPVLTQTRHDNYFLRPIYMSLWEKTHIKGMIGE